MITLCKDCMFQGECLPRQINNLHGCCEQGGLDKNGNIVKIVAEIEEEKDYVKA